MSTPMVQSLLVLAAVLFILIRPLPAEEAPRRGRSGLRRQYWSFLPAAVAVCVIVVDILKLLEE
jgi:hypothetical protein